MFWIIFLPICISLFVFISFLGFVVFFDQLLKQETSTNWYICIAHHSNSYPNESRQNVSSTLQPDRMHHKKREIRYICNKVIQHVDTGVEMLTQLLAAAYSLLWFLTWLVLFDFMIINRSDDVSQVAYFPDYKMSFNSVQILHCIQCASII